jgi:hypothetical protein
MILNTTFENKKCLIEQLKMSLKKKSIAEKQ